MSTLNPLRVKQMFNYKLPLPDTMTLTGPMMRLDQDRMKAICCGPFSNELYAVLAYNVGLNRVSLYEDEYFASAFQKVLSRSDHNSNTVCSDLCSSHSDSVHGLCFPAYQNPLYSLNEYKYLQSGGLRAGLGVFSLESGLPFYDNDLKYPLSAAIQYHLMSKNPGVHVIVAIVQPDRQWTVALGQITAYRNVKRNLARADFSIYSPHDLFSSRPSPQQQINLLNILDEDLCYYRDSFG